MVPVLDATARYQVMPRTPESPLKSSIVDEDRVPEPPTELSGSPTVTVCPTPTDPDNEFWLRVHDANLKSALADVAMRVPTSPPRLSRASQSPLPAADARGTPCHKARAHGAKRERPGREARAFTLNRSARRFRVSLLKWSESVV
jgi:hypothetical protein